MRDPHSLTYRVESWLLWTMTTGVGWPIAVTVALAFADRLPGLLRFLGLLLGGLLGGILVAVAGWFAVRRKIRNPGYWLVATVAAWPMSLLTAEFLFQAWPTLWGWFLAHAAGGALFGFVQAQSFHDHDADRPIWPFIALTAWLVTGALEVWLPSDGGIAFRLIRTEAVFGLIGWPLLTVITFFINLLLLPKPRGKAEEDGMPMWPKVEESEEEDSALP